MAHSVEEVRCAGAGYGMRWRGSTACTATPNGLSGPRGCGCGCLSWLWLTTASARISETGLWTPSGPAASLPLTRRRQGTGVACHAAAFSWPSCNELHCLSWPCGCPQLPKLLRICMATAGHVAAAFPCPSCHRTAGSPTCLGVSLPAHAALQYVHDAWLLPARWAAAGPAHPWQCGALRFCVTPCS